MGRAFQVFNNTDEGVGGCQSSGEGQLFKGDRGTSLPIQSSFAWIWRETSEFWRYVLKFRRHTFEFRKFPNHFFLQGKRMVGSQDLGEFLVLGFFWHCNVAGLSSLFMACLYVPSLSKINTYVFQMCFTSNSYKLRATGLQTGVFFFHIFWTCGASRRPKVDLLRICRRRRSIFHVLLDVRRRKSKEKLQKSAPHGRKRLKKHAKKFDKKSRYSTASRKNGKNGVCRLGWGAAVRDYGVATISRLLKIMVLLCRISSLL